MSLLTELYDEIANCQDCALAQGRKNPVPGEGPENAEIVFIGEGPGFHEDQQGRPLGGHGDDDFLGRFLLIFESILGPIERIADSGHFYFDTRLAPPDMLPWLAQWVGLVLDERWPEDRRRQLIRAAVAHDPGQVE